jgi:inactivated superfamily I helicase
MNRYVIALVVVFCPLLLPAQIADSLPPKSDIFEMLNTRGIHGNKVIIEQPALLKSAILTHIDRNAYKKIPGWRIRIYSSNAQTARAVSQTIKEEFEAMFPHIRADISFNNIDYRVMVGDFRTKSEAMRFHKEITMLRQYRSAVPVKEFIEFPPL